MLGLACFSSEQLEQGRVWGRVIWGGGAGGVLGGHVSRVSKASEEGFRGGGVNCSWCPSSCVLIQPLVLGYLMFSPSPSDSQYSVFISAGHLWVKRWS